MTKDYTDYRQANDSPGSLLKAHAATLYAKLRESSNNLSGVAQRAEGFSQAAVYLNAQEIQNGVTFVALDNDTLNWLLEIVNDYRNEKDLDEKFFLAESAVRRVVDLLGLED